MFPVSVALAGFVSHRFGPGAFFILSAVTIAGTLAWALGQAFRDFGLRAADTKIVETSRLMRTRSHHDHDAAPVSR